MEKLIGILTEIADKKFKGQISIIRIPGDDSWKVVFGEGEINQRQKLVLDEIPDNLDFEQAIEYAIIHRPSILEED